jgi:uncharacterized integral membrane protein (TIGR00698 family)
MGTAFCLSPFGTSAWALGLGVALALTLENPLAELTKKISPKLLSYSIVGLGAGMNLETVARAGLSGLGYTVVSISAVLVVGIFLGKLLGSEKETSLLITVGTAICGGSAIAAVAPVIRAKSHSITVALATVFILNALALLIFPWIGHALELTQNQFGVWSALAIHDTSSVVGAGLEYGAEALRVGTTIKLARALWIVPLTFGFGLLQPKDGAGASAKRPWFILGFVVMAALVTWIPALQEPGHWLELIARHGLVLALFFIGANLSRATLRQVGFWPLLQGFSLWVIVLVSSLVFAKTFVA